MKHPLSAATLSLIALSLAAPAARADTPIDFAPPVSADAVKVAAAPAPEAVSTGAIAVSFDPPGGTGGRDGGAKEQGSQEPGSQGAATLADTPHPTPHTPSPVPDTPHPTPDTPPSSDSLFTNGSDSLVARIVGSAEGTRTPDGHKTPAYYGHSDPGNGVWNLGSFSYQHAASTPQEADEKQLARLAQQDQSLRSQATQVGITNYETDLTSRLNGIDLANQSPLAALATDGGGYIDRLKQAQAMGLSGSEAVLWARVRAYLDPDTGRWNAPGLGNTAERISHDQERRMGMIAQAMEVYQAQVGQVAMQPQAPSPAPTASSTPTTPANVADQVVAQNVSKPSPQPPATTDAREAIADQLIAQMPPSGATAPTQTNNTNTPDAPIGFELTPAN